MKKETLFNLGVIIMKDLKILLILVLFMGGVVQATSQKVHCPVGNRPSLVPDPNTYLSKAFAFSQNSQVAEALVESSTVTISGTITESNDWDPNTTYYIDNPPLIVDGCDVVLNIPSDTLVIAAYGPGYPVIVVRNGATLIAGEPKLTTEPNLPVGTNNPVPPVWFVPEYDVPFQHNWCGILIERTAGTKSRLSNIYTYGFYNSFLVDQQLEYPIMGNYIQWCYNGIVSFGENQVFNNQVTFFGMLSDGISIYEGEGITFVSESGDGSIIFEGVDYECWNNVVDSGDRGVVAYGVTSPNDPPILRVVNTTVANCNTAFSGFDMWLGFDINYPGLYNNVLTKNFPDLPVDNPVYEVNDPFVIDPNDYRIFLDPNSVFVDAGWGYSVAMYPGWTTRADGIPDSNKTDIWVHHQTGIVDKGPTANLNYDDIVDELDLSELFNCWLETVPDPVDICKIGDLNNDGKVDFIDFSILASQWLFNEISVEIVNLETDQVLDLNNIQGYVGIRLKDINPLAGSVVVYLDNMLLYSVWFGWNDHSNIGFESDKLSNGWHTIRLVSYDIYGNVTNHEPIKVYFDNLLCKTSGDDYFHPSEDFKLSGFYNVSSSVQALLTGLNGQTLWSNTYSGNFANIVIPGTTFGSEQFCELTITEVGGAAAGEVVTANGSKSIKKNLKKKFKKSDYPGVVQAVVVLPNKDVCKVRWRPIIEYAKSCGLRNVSLASLYHHDVTKEFLTFLYNKGSLKYIYWPGHANSHVGADPRHNILGVARTHTICWKYEKRGWWDFFNNWDEIGVFSYTRQSDAEAYPLPGDHDWSGFDLKTLGMWESGNKKIVFIDGCLSAYFSDMAAAYGMFSFHNDQVYIGWKIKVVAATGVVESLLNTTEGVRLFWEKMGEGYSVYNALQSTSTIGGGVMMALWGPNGLMDLDDPDSDDNLGVYGEGLTAKLEP